MIKELVIIGGGPGGYVAAIRAAQLGFEVCLIEADTLGGTCLNRGCIPTKALYANAGIIENIKESSQFGIEVANWNMDINKVIDRKDTVVYNLVSGIEKLIKDNKIELIRGFASFTGKKTLNVITDSEKLQIEAEKIIIATGSLPSNPPIAGLESRNVMTSDDLLNLREVPEKFIIVGSGVIGMEFASIYNSFGSDVTVISSTLLKRVDKDITKRLPIILKKKGITIIDGARAQEIEQLTDKLLLRYKDKKGEMKEVEGTHILMASGRKANLSNLNLENTGVSFSEKGIIVDDNLETNIKDVYAIGDVIGKVMLAHVASHQGIAVVERMAGLHDSHDSVVPDCIFMKPEIACVGLSEEDALEKGYDVVVGKFPFSAIGKAMAMNETEGFVKIVANKETNKILGVHIMGPHASDLIHEMALAINKNMVLEDVINLIHAHPTLSEAVHESALAALDKAIHMTPPRRK